MRKITADEYFFLEQNGWTIECESPLEIRSDDGESFARGQAAECIIESIMNQLDEVKEEEEEIQF